MILTAAGQLFYQRAKQVLNDLRRAREEIEQTQGALSGTVTMGLSIMPHLGLLPKALPKFRERFSKVKIKVIEGLYPEIELGLRQGQIDFYLGASPEEGVAPGLQREELFKNTRTVIARKGHPLVKAQHLFELAQAEWATTSVSLNAENDLIELFHKHQLPQPKVMFQASSALSVMIALTHSDLIALLPVQWNDFHLTKNALEVIALKDTLPAPDIVLITRSGLPLTPAAEYFCDLLKRELCT
jgi:DNA-binding transcriptional LysR family regulator